MMRAMKLREASPPMLFTASQRRSSLMYAGVAWVALWMDIDLDSIEADGMQAPWLTVRWCLRFHLAWQ